MLRKFSRAPLIFTGKYRFETDNFVLLRALFLSHRLSDSSERRENISDGPVRTTLRVVPLRVTNSI